MDPTAKAAAHLLAQRLSSLQEELEEKLNRRISPARLRNYAS